MSIFGICTNCGKTMRNIGNPVIVGDRFQQKYVCYRNHLKEKQCKNVEKIVILSLPSECYKVTDEVHV